MSPFIFANTFFNLVVNFTNEPKIILNIYVCQIKVSNCFPLQKVFKKYILLNNKKIQLVIIVLFLRVACEPYYGDVISWSDMYRGLRGEIR